MRKTTCGKSNQNQYDPQIGAAAQANTAVAQKAQQFSEDYYTKYVAPLMEQMTSQSKESQKNQNDLFAMNMEQTKKAQERYDKYGIPAEEKYFKMVQDYSAPEEEQRQAEGAIGDIRTATATQQRTNTRGLAALGISPDSPAALAAASDMGLQTAAASAAASNRARAAAKSLGMSLTSDAANFGRGGQSGILQFGAAASGNTNSAIGNANGAISGANAGAQTPMAGYQTALKGYGANLDAYTSLSNSANQANAQGAAGLGQLAGTLGTMALMAGSDRRLKKNITHLAHMPNGLEMYRFEYINPEDGEGFFHGYMADEVIRLYPDAVSTREDGYFQVDYSKVPVR